MEPVTRDGAELVGAVVEFLAKVAGSLLIVWGFIVRVWKPFVEWRRRRLTDAIRLALKAELEAMAGLPERDQALLDKVNLALDRQEQVFSEIDLFVIVMADSRDRMDEVTDLLNVSGFASRDRRPVERTDRRRHADEAMAELQGQLRARRRRTDDARTLDEDRRT